MAPRVSAVTEPMARTTAARPGASILLDVGPAVGGHGQRGIGRYVRGLVRCVQSLPDAERSRIWAMGMDGAALEAFGTRASPASSLGFRPQDVGWLTGRVAVGRALRRSRANVFHATDPWRPWSPATQTSIVTVYDLIPVHEPEMLRTWRPHHQLIYRWYLRQLRLADRLVAISQTTADDVADRLDIPLERIEVIYPVVDAPERFERRLPEKPTFLVVGALDPHKQPELALRAFAMFRAGANEGTLRYIGPSSSAQVRSLRHLADSLGIADFVRFDGRVSDAELEQGLTTTTALLWTSRLEGFGLPPVEAAIRGVPVIAVDTPAARETLDGLAALVPGDVEAIASAMWDPNPPGAIAIDAARDKYGLAAVSHALQECYLVALDG